MISLSLNPPISRWWKSIDSTYFDAHDDFLELKVNTDSFKLLCFILLCDKRISVFGSEQPAVLFTFSCRSLFLWVSERTFLCLLWSLDYIKTHPHKWQASWQNSIWSKYPASGKEIQSSSLFMIGGWVTALIQSQVQHGRQEKGNLEEALAHWLHYPPVEAHTSSQALAVSTEIRAWILGDLATHLCTFSSSIAVTTVFASTSINCLVCLFCPKLCSLPSD